MPIPDYQDCMLPLLQVLADGESHSLGMVARMIADCFRLTDEERQQLLPSESQTVISNRVAWAKTYLKKAGLVEQPTRGMVCISLRGRAVLKENPLRIDRAFLLRYPAFIDFINRTVPTPELSTPTFSTPEESLEASYQALQDALADELLDRVKSCTPAFFERLVVELIVAMGYGGSFADAGQAIGRSGDGGIDGIVKEDRLGLDVICLQAKRWSKPVGRPDVQAFVGSMEGRRAKKGVMLTTATFTKDAREYVKQIERKIVLIDGEQLVRLMIEHGVGVATARVYVVKRLDTDYFE